MSENESEMVVYDVEEAAAEVARRTGRPLEIVEEILEAEFLFNAALGFYEIPDDEEGQEFMEEIRKVQADHPDLIPESGETIEDYEEIEERLVAFIGRYVADVDQALIEEVLDEHILYLEEKGILEPAEDE